jgi:predicted transcriptional regulator
MKKTEFLTEIEKYRQLTVGKGREIAEKADITYTKYQNYIKGAGANEEVFEQIISAIKEYTKEVYDTIEELSEFE